MESESENYLSIVNESIEKLGKEEGVVLGLSSIFLDRDALFRYRVSARPTVWRRSLPAFLCTGGQPVQAHLRTGTDKNHGQRLPDRR